MTLRGRQPVKTDLLNLDRAELERLLDERFPRIKPFTPCSPYRRCDDDAVDQRDDERAAIKEFIDVVLEAGFHRSAELVVIERHKRGLSARKIVAQTGISKGISGIYAEDAETALTYFRENYEDDTTRDAGQDDALDPLTTGGQYQVSWSIDGDEDLSPAQAALHAWQQNFRRGAHQPTNDEAGVFTVLDPATGRSIDIDLSEAQFAHLFH